MRSSVNKIPKFFLINAVCLTFLTQAFAQPIQLIPKIQENSYLVGDNTPSLEFSTFWEGTPPSIVLAHLPKLTVDLTSLVLQEMRRKVLIENYDPLNQDLAYEETRLQLFQKIGNFHDALELLSNTHLPNKDTLWVNLKWAQAEPKSACHKVENLLRTTPAHDWKIQNVYCLYSNGEKERGKVAAEILEETSTDIPSVINQLFDPELAVNFNKEIGESPFLLYVWCSLGHTIPENDLKTFCPASLRLVAQSEHMSESTRLWAAQHALDQGSLANTTFLSYLKSDFKNSLFNNFKSTLEQKDFQKLLVQFEEARDSQQFRLIAKAFYPLFVQLNPSPEALALTPFLIRVFLNVGEFEAARKWGTYYTREAPEEAVVLMPLLHIAFPQNPWGESQLKAWQTSQVQAPQRSYILRKILEALGENPGSAMIGEPLAPSWRQEQAILGEMDSVLLNAAADGKRTGEIYLLILSNIGDTSLSELPVEKIAHFIRALNKAGHSDKARKLALEYLVELKF